MTHVLGIFFKPKEFSREDTINIFIKNQIDRIYVSDFLISKMDSIKHLIYLADHRLYFISIYIENQLFGIFFYWKLNNTLLDDSVYGNKIMNFITEMEDETGRK